MSAAVQLSFSTAVVLQAIASGHRYGFDIMDATGLPSGTVYPALRRLERSGYLNSDWEGEREAHSEQRPARRYYELTATGVEALESALERFHGLRRMFPDEEGAAPADEAASDPAQP